MDKKLAEARTELEDLTSEYQREKDDLMDTIREQNREIKLLQQVMETVFSVKEIAKVAYPFSSSPSPHGGKTDP
jgi:kinesin family protein 3/17